MNMYILAEALPKILLKSSEKEKNPISTKGQNGVLPNQSEDPVASTASSSNWRQSKGAMMDRSRTWDLPVVTLSYSALSKKAAQT